ncbi:MAG: hypothetical protein AMS21_11280 [Gemmatimonas sp. SG8_38_2]|jgi:hypothetical protein|nr:MAG: hypothetical protein AMS21_11280 [Gemmatimonas sp. SG8_38_2]
MTLFEYLAIAFSLVLSFSGMRLISGLSFVVQKRNRYWVHSAFVCFQLSSTLAVFWNFWALRAVEWTFPSFVIALMSPAIIYYNACVLVPEDASNVASWRDYCFSVRKRCFIGLTAWMVIVAVISLVVVAVPPLHPMRAFHVLMLAASVSGLLSENPRVHEALSIFYLSILAFAMTVFAFRPGTIPT